MTDDGDVWWEGMTDEPPAHLTDWKGQDWTPASGTPAAHPNARFTAPGGPGPGHRARVGGPGGVPISAILFGGRRASVVPLVTEAFDWQHGVFLGSIMASETTAAAAGAVGKLRRDPFAMLPFCGYNMADYFGPLAGDRPGGRRRQAAEDLLRQLVPQGQHGGKFLWPGFGENSRVLEWVFERCAGDGGRGRDAHRLPAGRRRPSRPRASTCPARTWTSCSGSTATSGRPSCPSSRSTSPSSVTACPEALRERAGGPPQTAR